MQARPGLAETVDWRLYHVTDTAMSGGPDRVPQVVEQAVLGGTGVIQVRDKGLDDVAFTRLTRRCLAAVERAADQCGHRAAVFVNDRLRVAAELGLHIHLGQSDANLASARRLLGDDLLIGLSVSDLAQLDAELAEPTADVLGLSPIWSTPTKTDAAPPLNLEGARALVDRTAGRAALVAIGGINETNAARVIATGVDGICVVSAIATSADPRAAASRLLSLWKPQ